MILNKLEDAISEIEKDFDILSKISFRNYSAWIALRQIIIENLLTYKSPITSNVKNISLYQIVKIFFFSIKSYTKYFISNKHDEIFLGAATGILNFQDSLIDIYFPDSELNPNNTIYCLSFQSSELFFKNINYFKNKNTIADNFL